MAIVTEKHVAAKPVQVDPKTGKPLPLSQQMRSSSPTLEVTTESGSIFSSFWSGKGKKKGGSMEPPPATLKASPILSEKETMEVDVIKLLIRSYFNIVQRTVIDMVPKAIMLNLVQ
jgi:hypothetical protein